MTRTLAVFLSAILLIGCESPTSVQGRRVLAWMHTDESGNPEATLPDTVRAGRSFTVALQTYWPESGTEMEGTDLKLDDLQATLRPYLRDGVGPCCFQTVDNYTHQATIEFEEPGTATVRILAENGEWDLAIVVR